MRLISGIGNALSLAHRACAHPILGIHRWWATLVSVQFVETFGVSTSAVARCPAHDSPHGPATSLQQFEGSRLEPCTLPRSPRLRHTRRRGTEPEHRYDHACYACHHGDCNPHAVLRLPLCSLLLPSPIFSDEDFVDRKSPGRRELTTREAIPSLAAELSPPETSASLGPRTTRIGRH